MLMQVLKVRKSTVRGKTISRGHLLCQVHLRVLSYGSRRVEPSYESLEPSVPSTFVPRRIVHTPLRSEMKVRDRLRNPRRSKEPCVKLQTLRMEIRIDA